MMKEFTKKDKVVALIAIVTVVAAIMAAFAVGIEIGKQQVQQDQPAPVHQVLVIEKYTDAGDLVAVKTRPVPFNGTTLNTQNPFEKDHNVTKFRIRVTVGDSDEIG